MSDAVAANKAAGERVEVLSSRRVPELHLVPDDVAYYYDAVATRQVWPSDGVSIAERMSLPRGTEVEIKSAIRHLASGKRGRFYLRPDQHSALIESGGVYAFAVCSDDEREILALKIVPAETVDQLVCSWIDPGPTRSDYAQLTWTNVFGIGEVELG